MEIYTYLSVFPNPCVNKLQNSEILRLYSSCFKYSLTHFYRVTDQPLLYIEECSFLFSLRYNLLLESQSKLISAILNFFSLLHFLWISHIFLKNKPHTQYKELTAIAIIFLYSLFVLKQCSRRFTLCKIEF